ncbi:long-subunit fatty acid transport protein [Chitinophaga terrae (ex Kim and Jung 2007)]|uniref:hypothetical protein n=1 Tax=Chitinophaga terrae (ex Kim and Jung 2007) TaxID=408074 RepID=UPI00278BA69E|nr:hypothetical protein [Chitinophaga terrae (ex Kim and Jung 2007)]MDQ0106501.1 long-subunit fatty acid transport protein [Chitinophaga terrae (ex Kim and Jung 2007)]
MKGKLLAIFTSIFFILNDANGQDSHYWESGFSPGGFLFPGAVIANNRDSGLFFYNPALLAIKPKTGVSISANIYEWEHVNIPDGIASEKPLRSNKLRIVPQMVSGTVAFKKNISIGYALIHNPSLSYKVNQRQDKQMNVLDDSYSPGAEYYVGQYAAYNSVNQTIAAASAAMKLSERLAVGLSVEGHIRSQDFSEDYKSRALINTDSIALTPFTSVTSSYEASYTHIGIRFKAGLSYDAGPHHFGLLLSSPLVSIKGVATVQSDLAISNLQLGAGNSVVLNIMANDRQKNLPVTYKFPFSIAGAYAIDYNKGQVYIAAEYFHKVNSYEIITPRKESFIRPDTGNPDLSARGYLQFRNEHKSVINFALGLSHYIDPNFTAYGSFRTDFSYAASMPEEYNGRLPYVISWDVYHAQLGGNFRRKKFNLRAGLLLSYGRTTNYKQPVNFENPKDSDQLLGISHDVKGTFFSTGLLLSYIHNF